MSIMVTEVYEAFLSAGAPDDKAKAAAAAIPIARDLATKQDIAEQRAALTHDIAELRAALTHDIAELKKDVEVLKLAVFRLLFPIMLVMLGLLIKAAFFPG